MNDIKGRIRTFVVDNFLFGTAESLENDTSFLEEGIVDSTGILELIAFIEETFGVCVEDNELIPENLDSIDNVATFLETKLERTEAASLVG